MFEFVLIQPGTFIMGSPDYEDGRDKDEVLHKVTITNPFYMQTTTVTRKQWASVMKKCAPSPGRHDHPVHMVSWDDAQEFIKRLNQSGEGVYRLPTEAALFPINGFVHTFSIIFGNNKYKDPYLGPALCSSSKLDKYAWHSEYAPHAVKKKKPNAWGLYDMHGNVWEWCQDWYGDYPNKSVVNPRGPKTGIYRVCRGGDANLEATACRSANRSYDFQNINDLVELNKDTRDVELNKDARDYDGYHQFSFYEEDERKPYQNTGFRLVKEVE